MEVRHPTRQTATETCAYSGTLGGRYPPAGGCPSVEPARAQPFRALMLVHVGRFQLAAARTAERAVGVQDSTRRPPAGNLRVQRRIRRPIPSSRRVSERGTSVRAPLSAGNRRSRAQISSRGRANRRTHASAPKALCDVKETKPLKPLSKGNRRSILSVLFAQRFTTGRKAMGR